MLEVEIRHDIEKNYMVVLGGSQQEYMVQMLNGKHISGFLDLEVRELNNEKQYYYDITGKESVAQSTGRSRWGREKLVYLISQVLETVGRSREYLLDTKHFVLDPAHMYIGITREELCLCYAWSYEKDIKEQFTELFAYFLDKVDYEDQQGVELIYQLYDVSRNPNFTMQNLWEVLAKQEAVVIEEQELEQREEVEKVFVKEKTKHSQEETASFTEKLAIAIALQILWIVVLVIASQYGVFVENGGLSYTKVGVALVLVGILDVYMLSRIFDKKEELEKEVQETRRDTSNENKKKEKVRRKFGECEPQKKTEASSEKVNIVRKNSSVNGVKKGNPEEERKLVAEEPSVSVRAKKDISKFEREINSTIASTVEQDALQQNRTVVMDFDKTVLQMADIFDEEKEKEYCCYLIPKEEKQQTISIAEFPFFIGRYQQSEDNSLQGEIQISRMHCKLEQADGHFYLSDLQSTNGTYVNKKRLLKNAKQEIQEGDEIALADVCYKFSCI